MNQDHIYQISVINSQIVQMLHTLSMWKQFEDSPHVVARMADKSRDELQFVEDNLQRISDTRRLISRKRLNSGLPQIRLPGEQYRMMYTNLPMMIANIKDILLAISLS
jgi:hypothetical protein